MDPLPSLPPSSAGDGAPALLLLVQKEVKAARATPLHPAGGGCCCLCSCACWPPCASSCPPSSRVQVQLGFTYSEQRSRTECTDCFATTPCKVHLPKLPPGSASELEAVTTDQQTKRDQERLYAALGRVAHSMEHALTYSCSEVRARFLAAADMNRAAASVVYVSQYGGGLCATDHVVQRYEVGNRASATVTTQGFNKVFAPAHEKTATGAKAKEAEPEERTEAGLSTARGIPLAVATQEVHATIGPSGLLMWLPEPTMLYAGAHYAAPSVIELVDGFETDPYSPVPPPLSSASGGASAARRPCSSSLVWVEWLHAGRVSRGEVFDFESYRTRLHVHHRQSGITKRNSTEERKGGREDDDQKTPILLEQMTLEQEEGNPRNHESNRKILPAPDAATHESRFVSPLARRLAPYLSYCTVVLLGARVEEVSRAIHAHVNAWHLHKPVRPKAGVGVSSSSAVAPLVSCQWIDEPVGVTGSVRGCVLRLAAAEFEGAQALLQLYLAPLESLIQIAPPWAK